MEKWAYCLQINFESSCYKNSVLFNLSRQVKDPQREFLDQVYIGTLGTLMGAQDQYVKDLLRMVFSQSTCACKNDLKFNSMTP